MDTSSAAKSRTTRKHGARAAEVAALALLLADTASAALVDFSGTIVSVAVDSGTGIFAGLTSGDAITAQFSYGDSAAEASDFFSDAGQADWTFTGGAYYGRATVGAVSITGTGYSWVNLQDDRALSTSGATLASEIFGAPIAAGTLVDTWTVGTLGDGASFDASGRLVSGAALEFGVMTLSPGAFFDLSYVADPRVPGSATFFGIVEADALGNVIFSALGRAAVAPPPVPLPAPAWLLLSGIGLVAAWLRRRMRSLPQNLQDPYTWSP
jgi:hypothetical protein